MSETSTALLAVERVEKRRRGGLALRGVDFTAGPGEFIALLGPNGAGKSTLIEMITGLLRPDAGRILTLGRDDSREPAAALRGLGVVFQPQTLDLELSVQANLLFHARLHGMGRGESDRRMEALLERFGLAAEARTPARELSGGNRRRVELARAMLHAPRLLVMDEPTAGLDHPSRRDLLARTLELRRTDGTAVLWATHLHEEGEAADRVLLLDRGRLLLDAAPAAAKAAARVEDLAEACSILAARAG
jgi:ABC-2 type transport system ATP-binding protein